MSSGRGQAVGATRRRNRHIAHKRYCNALQGRTAQRGAHCRIGDSGGDRRSSGNSCQLVGETDERLAVELGVSERTIRNDAAFALAVDYL